MDLKLKEISLSANEKEKPLFLKCIKAYCLIYRALVFEENGGF